MTTRTPHHERPLMERLAFHLGLGPVAIASRRQAEGRPLDRLVVVPARPAGDVARPPRPARTRALSPGGAGSP
jgi:hypothetical protein